MRARRREIVDEYVEDGRAAIYTDQGMVVLLSELATSALRMLGQAWVEAEIVTERLVEEYGDPSDASARELTERALETLAEMSLVELDRPETHSGQDRRG
jgi:hypothetical protein